MDTQLVEKLREKFGSIAEKTLENEIAYDFSRAKLAAKPGIQIETPKAEEELQKLSDQIRRLKIGVWAAFGIAFLFGIMMHSIVAEDLEGLKANSSPKMGETIASIAARLEAAQKTIESIKGQGDERAATTSQSLNKTLEALTSVRKDLDGLKKNTEGLQEFHQTAGEAIRLLNAVDQDFKHFMKEPDPANSMVPAANQNESSAPKTDEAH